jgi:hypothetical protein
LAGLTMFNLLTAAYWAALVVGPPGLDGPVPYAGGSLRGFWSWQTLLAEAAR